MIIIGKVIGYLILTFIMKNLCQGIIAWNAGKGSKLPKWIKIIMTIVLIGYVGLTIALFVKIYLIYW